MNGAATNRDAEPYKWLRGDLGDRQNWNEYREKNPEFIPQLSEWQFNGTQLEGFDLSRALLNGAELREANLKGAILDGAILDGAILDGADLSGADLRGASFNRASLEYAEIRVADASVASFVSAHLQGADFQGSILEGANLTHVNESRFQITELSFQSIESEINKLDKKDNNSKILERLRDIKCKDPKIYTEFVNIIERSTGEELFKIYKSLILKHARYKPVNETQVTPDHESKIFPHRVKFQSANLNRACLDHAILDGVDLRRASLVGATLKKATLKRAQLERAEMREADASWAQLVGATLQGADLRGAILEKTNLIEIKANDEHHGDSDNALGAVNLQNANLKGADLRKACLGKADLTGSNLEEADLCGASLVGCQLKGAKLSGASLWEAVFSEADLQGVEGLSETQLAGTDVRRAILPDNLIQVGKLFQQGLKQVEEIARSLQQLFLILLSACLYCGITIASTSHAQIIANTASIELPIIGAKISILGFYFLTPCLLLFLYMNYHLYMQRLWEAFVKLPAFFPEDIPLDERAYPRHMSGFIRASYVLLRRDGISLEVRLHGWLFIFLTWMSVPLTQLFFWFSLLPRRDGIGQAGVLLIIPIFIGSIYGLRSFQRAVGTLHHREHVRFHWRSSDRPPSWKKKHRVVGVWLPTIVLVFFAVIFSTQAFAANKDQVLHWGWSCFLFVSISAVMLLGPHTKRRLSTHPDTKWHLLSWRAWSEFWQQNVTSYMAVLCIPGLIMMLWLAMAYWIRVIIWEDGTGPDTIWGLVFFIVSVFPLVTIFLRHFILIRDHFERGRSKFVKNQSNKKKNRTKFSSYHMYTHIKIDNPILYVPGIILVTLVFVSLFKISSPQACMGNKFYFNDKVLRGFFIDLFCYPRVDLTNKHLSIKSDNWPGFTWDQANLEKNRREMIQGAFLRKANLRYAIAPESFFAKADLRQSKFVSAMLEGADFRWAKLQGSDFEGALLAQAKFYRADLRGANFKGTNLIWSDFSKAHLHIFTNCDFGCLKPVNFQDANLYGAIFNGANLKGANLTEVNLQNASLKEVYLNGAILQEANLKFASLELASLNSETVESINDCDVNNEYFIIDKNRCDVDKTELPGADLSGANLSEADLSGADLSGAQLNCATKSDGTLACADLSGAKLSCATKSDGTLACADLSGANLSEADLSGANLSEANLIGADLSGAKLSCATKSDGTLACADFSGADLSGADLSGADLSGANFSDAKGLKPAQLGKACRVDQAVLPEYITKNSYTDREPPECKKIRSKASPADRELSSAKKAANS